MAIAWARIQITNKIWHREEETSPRRVVGYRLSFEFKKETPGGIKEKLPAPFLWHVMQQAITLEKEHEPDIGYSEYKIIGSRCRVDVKFLKHSWLHPIAPGHEDERYEEVDG